MSTESLPTECVPASIEWSIKTNAQKMISPLSQATQTAVLLGDRWTAVLTFPNQIGDAARKMRAFLASLRGITGRFYVTPYDYRTAQGTPTGTPKVKGASQTGTHLHIDGCTAGVTGWLLAGDFFQVGSELKMVTADCNTDGAGETTVYFQPPLRTSPADNADIITTDPKATMMLVDDNQCKWSAGIGNPDSKLYAFSLSAIEAIDI